MIAVMFGRVLRFGEHGATDITRTFCASAVADDGEASPSDDHRMSGFRSYFQDLHNSG